MPEPTKTSQLIFVDDDKDEQYLVRSAIEELPHRPHMLFFDDGEELLHHLNDQVANQPQVSQYALASNIQMKNTVIVLDINMPKLDGFQVLQMLKQSPGYANIPTILYTTTRSNTEIRKAYAEGANSVIIKPSGFDETVTVFLNLCNYWFNTVRLS